MKSVYEFTHALPKGTIVYLPTRLYRKLFVAIISRFPAGAPFCGETLRINGVVFMRVPKSA